MEEVTKAHAESSAARAQAKQVESEAAAAGGLEPGKADKARRVDQLLMGTFTGGKADGAPDEVNKYMYVTRVCAHASHLSCDSCRGFDTESCWLLRH